MLITTQRLISRIMFIVMLVTFVSPTLGWGMVATHDQLSHGLTDSHAEEWHGEHHHHDEHDHNTQHQDPHSSIGHLFTHMPVGLFGISPLIIQPPARSEIYFVRQSILAVVLAPPLRPPKTPLSC